jgi:hypothetical protein
VDARENQVITEMHFEGDVKICWCCGVEVEQVQNLL